MVCLNLTSGAHHSLTHDAFNRPRNTVNSGARPQDLLDFPYFQPGDFMYCSLPIFSHVTSHVRSSSGPTSPTDAHMERSPNPTRQYQSARGKQIRPIDLDRDKCGANQECEP